MVNFPSSIGNGPENWFEPKLLSSIKKKHYKTITKQSKRMNKKHLFETLQKWAYRESNLDKFPISWGTGPVRLFMPKLLLNFPTYKKVKAKDSINIRRKNKI